MLESSAGGPIVQVTSDRCRMSQYNVVTCVRTGKNVGACARKLSRAKKEIDPYDH